MLTYFHFPWRVMPFHFSQGMELRRFALAFIHSHSGATGVFRNAFREFVERLLPVYQKHCRRHREFYCCLCCWRFRRYTLWISANICVGHVRYCYLFNVVYFLICTLKNCKNKRIFVSNKNVLPGPSPRRLALCLSTVITVMVPSTVPGTRLALWSRPATKSTN